MSSGFWRQAITESDNVTISPSFAAAAFGIYILLPVVIVVLVSVTVLDVVVNHHDANPGGLGGGIAGVIAAIGAYIVSLAVLLNQDKKPEPPQVTTTTTTTAPVAPGTTTTATTATTAQPSPAEAVSEIQGPPSAVKKGQRRGS